MSKEKDEELKRIKRRRKEEMMRNISDRAEEENQPMKPLEKPLDLTDDMFKKFVEDNSLSVIDVWAPWCGPCHIVSPVIEELARDYVGKISFGKLNVDENKKVATQYGIRSIPTLLVFKKGKLVDQIVGALPRQMLEQKITKHL